MNLVAEMDSRVRYYLGEDTVVAITSRRVHTDEDGILRVHTHEDGILLGKLCCLEDH